MGKSGKEYAATFLSPGIAGTKWNVGQKVIDKSEKGKEDRDAAGQAAADEELDTGTMTEEEAQQIAAEQRRKQRLRRRSEYMQEDEYSHSSSTRLGI